MCLVVTTLVYAPSLTGAYVYEDRQEIAGGGPLAAVTLSTATPIPRALTMASYALTRTWISPEAWAQRAVSLGWHLLNGVLLWIVARRVVTEAAAVVASALLLLLPIQTEAVAAMAYRGDLIATAALLASIACVQRGWMAAAWLCAAGAVLGKETGIVALILVPLWAWRFESAWSWRAVLGWGVASLGPLVALLAWFPAQQVPLLRSLDEFALTVAAFGRLVALIPLSVVQPGVLSLDHDWAHLTPGMGWGTVILAVWGAWLAPPIWRFALAWVVGALSLRLIFPLPEFHERHLYATTVGLSLAVGATVWPPQESA